MSRKILTLISLIILSVFVIQIQGQIDCTITNNTYWTGYRCACKVGYKNQSNICKPLTLMKTQNWVVRQPSIVGIQGETNSTTKPTDKPTPVNNNCFLPFQYFDGQGCVCLPGYTKVNSLCQPTSTIPQTQCPLNSKLIGQQCVCNSGYIKVNNNCILSNSSGCGSNSYDNGLGFCVCPIGYYKLNGTCIAGTPCPPSSTRNSNGQCICDNGLTKYGDYCAKCPLGAIYDTYSQKCLYICGQNAQYNNFLQKCQCLDGYGIYQNSCGYCPFGYFVQNNYCVSCPINSIYNSKTRKCDCSEGYIFNQAGFCVKKCANDQIYNSKNGNCDCLQGLGRLNGVCQVCPFGFSVITDGTCKKCNSNENLVCGKCVCKDGYIPNSFGICVLCSSNSNSFLLNGKCAKCPGDLIYNGQTCSCPLGKSKNGIRCKQTCKSDQLIDQQGLCYTCPIYEIISQGKCVCQKNYIRNSTAGQCQLFCPVGQFKYQGKCAQCPLNLQYRVQIGGCACQDGYYLNTYGVCEQVVLPPVECQEGFFFSKQSGCTACPVGCKTCSSASVCLSCSNPGFSVLNGLCQASCGDGQLALGEQCDDKNLINGDGCSSQCRIQSSFSCSGQPSVCIYNGPAICGNKRIQTGQQCDDGNLINGDGCSSTCRNQSKPSLSNLSLVGNVTTNINNVFVVLKTSKVYRFANDNQMQSFIQTKFPDSNLIPAVYCSQRQSPELDTFDCLIIYSSGIPNQKYKIQFSYNYQGQTGFLSVDVNPLISSNTKSRKTL